MSAAGSPTDRHSNGFSRLTRRALFPLALSAALATGAPGPFEPPKTLVLGYVESQPAPGRARVPLEQSVVRIRQDYGRSILVEMTHGQEMLLRDAGYEIHLVENGYRIGLGRYAFDVPAGPQNLPADLLWRERKGETETSHEAASPP